MNRTIIVLFTFVLSLVVTGCAYKPVHREYSPLDEHDDAIFHEVEADVSIAPGEDGLEAAETDPEAPGVEVEVEVAEPEPEPDPIYDAEVKRRQLEKSRRKAAYKLYQELTGGK